MYRVKNAPIALSVCSAFMMLGQAVFSAAHAAAPVGPGKWRVDTAEDVSYVEEGLALPSNAGSTVRRGIFYPKGGPVGVSEVLWRNVKLSDIETFTGKVSCEAGDTGKKYYYWKDAQCFHVITNTAQGYVQCQLQMQYGNIAYAFIMRYSQDGNDVKGKIYAAKHVWTTVADQYLGCDMVSRGEAITVTNTPYVVENRIRAISDLGIVLRADGETAEAPEEIVLASTDEEQGDEEVYRYYPCLTKTQEVICRNLDVNDIAGISGEISCSDFNSGKWTAVQGYCKTVKSSYVQMNLVWQNGGKSKRYGVNVRFQQYGADVVAYAHWAGYSYDSDDISAPIGDGIKGAEIGITNVANTSRMAIRNLNFRFHPKNRVIGDYESCIVKEDGWTKIWTDLDLSRAILGPALMGGGSLDSKWNVASNYNRSASSSVVTNYYQYKRNDEVFTIGFMMQQQANDVYAKILNARYNFGKQLGELLTGDYQTCVTNTVNGKSSAVHRTIAICHLNAEYPAKKRHTVTVGDNFDPSFVPVRLEDIKLAFAPAAGSSIPVDFALRGYGAVGASGAGEVKLNMDLPDAVALDVDSGTAVIDAPRTVGGKVNVADGASLKFVLATGVRPALSARFFNIEPGAEMVLASESRVADIPPEGETFKLVTGCNYADYSFQDVDCTVSGQLSLRKARLFVDEDGDIAVEIKPKTALRITVR